jgi:hypothetical protein
MQTKKYVSPDDVSKALREMAQLRDRLDYRRRDLRLMFIQSPEIGRCFEAFQRNGGVTGDEWDAFMSRVQQDGLPPLRMVVSKAHLRLIKTGEHQP